MGVFVSAPVVQNENYSEQYKIQLCNTLPTKTEIRECLEQRAQEYEHEQCAEGAVIGFILLAIVIWIGYMFYKDWKSGR